MCIIAIKKANQPLPEEKIMETMFNNNPDGAGFCYLHKERVIIEKGFMSFKAFTEALSRVSEKIDTCATPMVFHFRISTHGGISGSLCHPFPVSRKMSDLRQLSFSTNLAAVHNGIIPIRTRKGVSDTMEYIVRNLSRRYKWDREFYKKEYIRKAILTEIGSSKMAFLNCSGEIYTVGEFVEEDGILYSNTSYKERECLFQFCWDDYADYKKLMPLDDGYIVTEDEMIECDEANYFLGKGGKLYKYNEYLDVCFETKGVAYTVSGFVATYNEDEAIWMNVMR